MNKQLISSESKDWLKSHGFDVSDIDWDILQEVRRSTNCIYYPRGTTLPNVIFDEDALESYTIFLKPFNGRINICGSNNLFIFLGSENEYCVNTIDTRGDDNIIVLRSRHRDTKVSLSGSSRAFLDRTSSILGAVTLRQTGEFSEELGDTIKGLSTELEDTFRRVRSMEAQLKRLSENASQVISISEDVFEGGVSTAQFDVTQGRLLVTGWFVPSSIPTALKLFDEDGAEIAFSRFVEHRPDVSKRFPHLNTVDCGFRLEALRITPPKRISLKAYSRDRQLAERQKDVTLVDAPIQKRDPNFHEIEEIEITMNGERILFFRKPTKRIRNEISLNDFSVKARSGNHIHSLAPKSDTETLPDPVILDKFNGYSSWIRDYVKGNYHRVSCDAELITQQFNPDTSILDIGGIPPLLSVLLADMGFGDITIIDPFPDEYEALLRSVGVKSAKANVFDSAFVVDREYMLVCLNEVIEHLSGDLIEAFQNVVSTIQDGGYLYLTTPNQRSIHGLYGQLVTGSGLASKPYASVFSQYESVRTRGYFGHIREYTPREIEDFASMFGLELVDVQYRGRPATSVENAHLAAVIGLERYFDEFKLFAKYLFRKTG